MKKTLDKLTNGENAIITGIEANSTYRSRLTELGFIEGNKITLIRRALFGSPIQVNIAGYDILLRKSEAKYILINEEENKNAWNK